MFFLIFIYIFSRHKFGKGKGYGDFLSVLLVVIFRVGFYLGAYPAYYSIGLYSILILGIYYLFLRFFRQTKGLLHNIN